MSKELGEARLEAKRLELAMQRHTGVRCTAESHSELLGLCARVEEMGATIDSQRTEMAMYSKVTPGKADMGGSLVARLV